MSKLLQDHGHVLEKLIESLWLAEKMVAALIRCPTRSSLIACFLGPNGWVTVGPLLDQNGGDRSADRSAHFGHDGTPFSSYCTTTSLRAILS